MILNKVNNRLSKQIEDHFIDYAFCIAHEYDRNTTKYTCDTIDCRCIKNEMLCGKDGSIGMYK